MTNWEAYYKIKDGTKLLIIEGLTFNEIDSTMQAKWTSDGQEYSIDGTLKSKKKKKDNKCKVDFVLQDQEKIKKRFRGYIDSNRSRIRGTWQYDTDGTSSYHFDFILAEKVDGTLHMKITSQIGSYDVSEEVQVDYK